jgi:hypothetical protein
MRSLAQLLQSGKPRENSSVGVGPEPVGSTTPVHRRPPDPQEPLGNANSWQIGLPGQCKQRAELSRISNVNTWKMALCTPESRGSRCTPAP